MMWLIPIAAIVVVGGLWFNALKGRRDNSKLLWVGILTLCLVSLYPFYRLFNPSDPRSQQSSVGHITYYGSPAPGGDRGLALFPIYQEDPEIGVWLSLAGVLLLAGTAAVGLISTFISRPSTRSVPRVSPSVPPSYRATRDPQLETTAIDIWARCPRKMTYSSDNVLVCEADYCCADMVASHLPGNSARAPACTNAEMMELIGSLDHGKMKGLRNHLLDEILH